MKTKVIFRKWKNGDIIALFPEEMANHNVSLCNCYEHIGQHGMANPLYVIQETTPAKPEEYVDLKAELENYGPEDAHYDLIVCQKYTQQMFKNREKAHKEFYANKS